ncbi:MAG TPA: 2-oxoglutarate dehydrogenase E1 component, partial [Coxiellaceae bacterium]|nr:2-oxoglutarate dehydrogenase E1 component [Coxiellaceae bacterium]
MQKKTFKELEQSSYLFGGNAEYLEEIYDRYLTNPNSVDKEWRDYFQSLPQVGAHKAADISHEAILQSLREQAKSARGVAVVEVSSEQERVDNLITAYRNYGHIAAKLDPLGLSNSQDPRLLLSHYGLGSIDLKKTFATRGVLPKAEATLEEIFTTLQAIYCGTLTYEYTYIENATEQQWLQEYIESKLPRVKFDNEKRKKILRRLLASEGLEKYLDVKYVGQKRFSLEGGEAMIPMMDELTEKAAANNTREVIIGMAHRGRLNMLLNVMGKSSKELFQEFEGTKDYGMTSGDVKYHLGFSSDVQTAAGPV